MSQKGKRKEVLEKDRWFERLRKRGERERGRERERERERER